jgi:hypothetical protein
MKKKFSKTAAGPRRELPIDWNSDTGFKMPIPSDDPQRLADLRTYDMLDSPPDAELDQITLLASQVCSTPIALISLVDSDRQWFKSKVGLRLSESSRDIAFCAHAIMQHDLFIVPDALKDRRFAHNPLVTSAPNIRFYAGVPLISPDRHALGTLCVIDRVPRQLSPDQEKALRALSQLVMAHLDLHRRLEHQRHALIEGDHHQRKSRKAERNAKVFGKNCAESFLKAGHEVRAHARGLVAVMNRALAAPCTTEQRSLLQAARASASSLLGVSRELAKMSQKILRRR